MKKEKFYSELNKIIETYTRLVSAEFQRRIKAWPTDLSRNELHEVIGALLSRQATLVTHLAASPSSWNGHIAPLYLRAMADVYINVAWVLCDPDDRAKKFILYGLGQAKLELEHRLADMESRQPSKEEMGAVEVTEAWINRQRATFLTEVNLGSWSGLTTRKMAEESGCIDFYNYVFTPFSSCVHSTWNHIAKYDLRPCSSPLHRYHQVPSIVEAPADPHYLHLGARYLQKTFSKFDDSFNLKSRPVSALDMLSRMLVKLDREIIKTSRRRNKAELKNTSKPGHDDGESSALQ